MQNKDWAAKVEQELTFSTVRCSIPHPTQRPSNPIHPILLIAYGAASLMQEHLQSMSKCDIKENKLVTWWHFIYYAAPSSKNGPWLLLWLAQEYTVSTAIGLIHKVANWSQNVQKSTIFANSQGWWTMCTKCTNVHTEHSKWTQGKQNVQLVAQNVSRHKPSWSYAHTCVNIWAQTAN